MIFLSGRQIHKNKNFFPGRDRLADENMLTDVVLSCQIAQTRESSVVKVNNLHERIHVTAKPKAAQHSLYSTPTYPNLTTLRWQLSGKESEQKFKSW